MANHRWDTEPPAALPSRLAARRRAAGLNLPSHGFAPGTDPPDYGSSAFSPGGAVTAVPEEADAGTWQLPGPDSAPPESHTGRRGGAGAARRWRFPLRAGILAACLMLAAAAAIPMLRGTAPSEVLSVELGSSLAESPAEAGPQGQDLPGTDDQHSPAAADAAGSGPDPGETKSPQPSEGSGTGTGSEDVSGTGGELVVHVAGAVAVPGLVRISAGSRVADAVAAAGGATEQADLTRVNLAAPMTDGSMVVVPAEGDPLGGPAGSPASGPAGPVPPGGAAGAESGRGTATVNLNTAGESELQTLPRVGPVLAARIIAWRTEHGPFQRVEDLDAVPGIGEAMLAALLPLVTV